MAMPRVHALAGALAGLGVYAATRRRDLAALVFAGSVFIDVDHLGDVAYYRASGRRDRSFVPLHAVELLLPAFGLAACRDARAASLLGGVLLHLATDAVTQPGRWPSLFLAYRLGRRFRSRSYSAASQQTWRYRLGGGVAGSDWRRQPFWTWF